MSPHVPVPPPGDTVLVSRACNCNNAGEPPPGEEKAHFYFTHQLKDISKKDLFPD